MTRFDWADEAAREQALARPAARSDDALLARVSDIVAQVRSDGWAAVNRLAREIDGAPPRTVSVAEAAPTARAAVSTEAQAAMALAAENIRAFHCATMPSDMTVETTPGVRLTQAWRPLDRAGLYVPGGSAPLFSTLLMLGIPAKVAGVRELVVTTPPTQSGAPDPAIVLAAELCGIETVWLLGGAQAIAAMAFGAGEVARVDRIFGPGNRWVAAAKTMVAGMPGGPGIDLPAGPSELMAIADDSANPAVVAADLLSQAEHDADAQVLLVSPSAATLDAVERCFADQRATLPRDVAPLRAILCRSLGEAVEIANLYAPEHLSLACDGAGELTASVRNCGALFVGHDGAESFGDYLTGGNHVLPTDGAARFTSGVTVHSFLKPITVQQIDRDAAATLAEPAALLARLEGLEAHARAAEARLRR